MERIIAVDLDGVIGNFMAEFNKAALHRYGIEIQEKDVKEFEVHKVTELTRTQQAALVKDPKLYKRMQPYEGAADALSQLSFLEFRIIVLTDRTALRDASFVTLKWLVDHGLYFDNLVIRRSVQKYEYLETKGIKLLVEDKLATAIDASSICKHVFLIDRPWNQKNLTPPEVVRTGALSDVPSFLERYLDED